MAYRPRTNYTLRIVGIVVALVVQAGLIYGIAFGLVQNFAKNVVHEVETTVLPPPPPKDDKPPPPPPKVEVPPPYIPPPDISIEAPPSASAPTHVQSTNKVPSDSKYPTPRTSRRPDYPPKEKTLGHEGKVVLHLCVDLNGTITEANVQTSSGYPALDQSALDWAKSIQWNPFVIAGQKQAGCWDQPYRFVLRNG